MRIKESDGAPAAIPGGTPATAAAGNEQAYEGLAVSSGVAIGIAHVIEAGAVSVPEYRLTISEIEPEKQRFEEALAMARRQLKKLQSKAAALPGATGEELGYLLDAHQQMLTGSRLVRGTLRRITELRVNAEAAVQAEISEITQGFVAMNDAYLAARADDIREVGNRLIRNLTKSPYKAFSMLPQGAIVIAEELSPADTALLDPTRVAGFATVLGGAESHTAIMARSLGLPAVLGVPGLIRGVKSGDILIVDGSAGKVIVNPAFATVAEYERRRAEIAKERRDLRRLRKLPSITRDGSSIGLQANVELPAELDAVLDVGATGIGLLRSEFMFMNRPDIPTEDEQYAVLRDLVVGLGGRPLTVRTLDIGGDKLATSLGSTDMGPNPALGLRAIRLSLKIPALLDAQLGAILRASAHGPVRILIPMVSSVSEILKVREALGRVVRRLKRRREKIADPLPPLGAMIEIPGAALAADAFAMICDFFSIGTNDLTMYTLAIDRGDEQVAHLYDPLHPAVLRLIQFATEAALRARIPVSVCGEVAGDPRYTPLLLGLGIRDLSMAPHNLPRVKQRVRGLTLSAAVRRARLVMEQADSGRIATLLDDFDGLA